MNYIKINKGEKSMQYKFYDVKKKESVVAEVVGKQEYGDDKRKRYALKAKTQDGRNLTTFVSKQVYDKF